MSKMQQKILCINTDLLFEKGKWNGLKTTDLDFYYNLFLSKSEFRIREQLESDPKYKQIIPQVILHNNGKYFLHRQISANETRLNSLCPLPLGGHVEEFDKDQNHDLIEAALLRELNEEVDLKSSIINKHFIGLIYIENENPVNELHIGLLYIFDLDGQQAKIREPELEEIGWVDHEYLIKHLEELTYWSRVFVQAKILDQNIIKD